MEPWLPSNCGHGGYDSANMDVHYHGQKGCWPAARLRVVQPLALHRMYRTICTRSNVGIDSRSKKKDHLVCYTLSHVNVHFIVEK